jgi:hypothetical protein
VQPAGTGWGYTDLKLRWPSYSIQVKLWGELAVMGYSNKRGARSTRRHASMDAAIIPL